MNYQQIARETAKKLVRKYFKNDYGQPFELTDGQADLFLLIFTRKYPRNQVITPTQYGKSDVISMALILRSETFNENWAIVSGSLDKSMIIMSKVIQHIFDNEKFYKKLELDASIKLDKLRRERNKEHITWLGGGGIKIFTANSRNRQQVSEALTGFGSPNIVEDESAIIPNDVQAMVLRMLGGHQDNFLLKIGNPFYRNHFLKTWNSSKYHKIFIDYKQALSEGRYTIDFIEEMRNEPFFDVLYECKFPSNDEILKGGYRQLISDEILEAAFITQAEFDQMCTREIKDESGNTILKVPEGQIKLGCDFAGAGTDRNAYVARWPKVLRLLSTNLISDTMKQVPIVEDYIEAYKSEDKDVAIDYGGLGQGVGDRLIEKDHDVNCVMFGSSAPKAVKHKYKNMRSYMYYELAKWIKDGGKILKDDSFYELLVVNYSVDSEKKFQIQPKEELKKIMKELRLSVTSPDVADAAALTCADNTELVDEDDYGFV